MNNMANHTKIKKLDFTTDSGFGERARIGLLVLESDQTVETELKLLTDIPGVSIYHSRLANDLIVTPETLANMEKELPIAAGLLPKYMALSALGYGCTSASTIIGEDRVQQILNQAHPNVPTSNPLTAAKAALKALNVKRLALLTPYTPEVTQAMQSKFIEAGIEIAIVGSFYEESDLVVGKISSQSILDAAIAIGANKDCDGVFISCTSLRAAAIIEKAEDAIGKPVTASNHALAWHLLRLAGIEDKQKGYGKLFEL